MLADIAPGIRLGQYQVTEFIGSGGMARVFKAYHAALDRFVAIKVLPPTYAAEPAFRQRFEQEARTVARLRHSNILEVFDFGEFEGAAYIVMAYMAGGTLAPRLGAPIPSIEAVEIMSEVAAGLDYAHDRGVLHRDVKPGNIFFSTEGTAVLGDFGLAKILETAKGMTALGTTLGTPDFMSPEQALGRPVDRRTDVYALGAVLYMMLTGRTPYTGDTPLSTMYAHVREPLALPRTRNPQISIAVEDVLIRALAKDPGARFPTTGEFASAFAAAAGLGGPATSRAEAPTVLGSSIVTPHPEGSVPSAPASQPPGGDAVMSAELPIRRQPHPARPRAAVTVAIAAFAGAAILAFLGGRNAQVPTGGGAAPPGIQASGTPISPSVSGETTSTPSLLPGRGPLVDAATQPPTPEPTEEPDPTATRLPTATPRPTPPPPQPTRSQPRGVPVVPMGAATPES